MAKIWLGVVALCLAACSSSATPPASEDRPEESEPPETTDFDELSSWVERVVEAFCKREDMTSALVNHLEGVEP